MATTSYRVKRAYEGTFYVYAEGDEYRRGGEVVARVARFMPGPMVSVDGQGLYSPGLAKAVARAMTRLANELTKGGR